jgi:hypothetical protein
MASYDIDRELGWNDQISRDGPDYITLPEGEYEFVVDHFDRERHNGSEKLPPCWKAVLFLKVETPEGVASIRHQLFLHTKTEGMLCAFFESIGQRQHGQTINMNWDLVPGAHGRAKIGVREYNGKQYNEVKRFLAPAASAAAPAPAYQQPAQTYQQTPTYQQPPMPGFQQPTGGYTPGKF